MLRPGGYFVCDDPDPTKSKGQKARTECDTFTCAHHGGLVLVKPMCDPADMGGLCKVCMGLICKACNATGRCDPLEEKLKRAEARDRFRRELTG